MTALLTAGLVHIEAVSQEHVTLRCHEEPPSSRVTCARQQIKTVLSRRCCQTRLALMVTAPNTGEVIARFALALPFLEVSGCGDEGTARPINAEPFFFFYVLSILFASNFLS